MKASFLGFVLFSVASISFAKAPTCFQRVSKHSFPEISDILCFETLHMEKKTPDSYSLIVKEPTRNLDAALHVTNILSRPTATKSDPNNTWDFYSHSNGEYEFADEEYTYHQINQGRYEGSKYGLVLNVKRQEDGELALDAFFYQNLCPGKPSISLTGWRCDDGFCRDGISVEYCQMD